MTSLQGWERFSAAGIAVDCPPRWTIGSRNIIYARKGELWFAPDSEAGGRFHIFWGPLGQMKQFTSVERQARETLSAFQRDTKWGGGKAELTALDQITIDGHEAYYAHLKAIRLAPGVLPFLPSRTAHDIEAAYLHCPNTERYFALILELPRDSGKIDRTLIDFTKNFSCHMYRLPDELRAT